MQLNEAQLKVVAEYAHVTPAGHVLFHGPPGCGKTYFISQLIKPYLQHSKKMKIMLLSPTNNGDDILSQTARSTITELETTQAIPTRKVSSVRMHTPDTERDIVMQEAKKARGRPEDATPPLAVQGLDQADQDTLTQLQTAKMLKGHYDMSVKQRFELINDDRVNFLTDFLGYKMLEICGYYETGPKPEADKADKSAKFKNFLEVYRQYENGHDLDKAALQSLKEHTKQLETHTLSQADVMCSTPDNMANARVFRYYNNVKLIVLDDAARVPEPATLAVYAHYAGCTAIFLIGDKMQLKFVVPAASNVKDRMVNQLELSLMTRLESAGFPTVLFDTQYRMVPEIAAVINDNVYHGPS